MSWGAWENQRGIFDAGACIGLFDIFEKVFDPVMTSDQHKVNAAFCVVKQNAFLDSASNFPVIAA